MPLLSKVLHINFSGKSWNDKIFGKIILTLAFEVGILGADMNNQGNNQR